MTLPITLPKWPVQAFTRRDFRRINHVFGIGRMFADALPDRLHRTR